MARYPTYDEYKDKPEKGIKKCDELLKRQPKDITLLTTKLSLLSLLEDTQQHEPRGKDVVNQLMACNTRSLEEIVLIEETISERNQNSLFPQPLTSGPEVAEFWDTAFKAYTHANAKLTCQSLRFSRAIFDNRLQDAQQALIRLKVLEPKNRVFYMAHAAVTQMLSTTNEDLQSRLALGLARKAVNEGYDGERELDCRVPGQIFALQDERKNLEVVVGGRFGESKQVFDAVRRGKKGRDVYGEGGTSATWEADVKEGTPEWLDQQIGAFKSKLASLVSGGGESAGLYALAADAVRTYRSAVQSMDRFRYRNVCDLIFVAISSLIRVWEKTGDYSNLVQASFLGEALLRDNQHIHEAKVILIHLYMRLDLAAQAMKHWDSLSVKEVQFDTIGHAFLTRLSIIHPHKFTTVKTKHTIPHDITANALAMYHRCEEKLAQTAANVLTNGQTGMLFDLQELRENLRLSLTRRIISLEQRRLARLFRHPLDMNATQISPRLTAQWLATKDNRDFKAAFDYGYNIERVLHAHTKPETWMLYALAADTVWCIVGGLVAPVKDTEALLEHLDKSTAAPENDTSNISQPEQQAGQLFHRMLQLLVKPDKLSSKSIIELTTLLTDIDLSFLITTEETPAFPLNLRQQFLTLDTLRTISAFTAHLLASTSKQSPTPKKDLTALQSKAAELFAQIQSHAAEQISRLQGPHIRLSLQQDKGLWKVLQGFGEDTIREFGAGIVEAAKDGWKGVGVIAKP